MAEREGFEPSVPFGTHAFQACALSRSAISPGNWLAEREGFEPSMGFTPYSLSRGAPSAARPPLRTSHTECNGFLAEREGFEPSRRVNAWRFSRPLPSTTRPPLRAGEIVELTSAMRSRGTLNRRLAGLASGLEVLRDLLGRSLLQQKFRNSTRWHRNAAGTRPRHWRARVRGP